MPVNTAMVTAVDFRPDWDTTYTAQEAEVQLKGFKFSGPGWYLTETDTVLVAPSEAHRQPWRAVWPDDTKFRFFVWNRTGLGDVFNFIANAPVRRGTPQ